MTYNNNNIQNKFDSLCFDFSVFLLYYLLLILSSNIYIFINFTHIYNIYIYICTCRAIRKKAHSKFRSKKGFLIFLYY